MKKTTSILKSMVTLAAVTILVACKKEIQLPQNNLNSRYKEIRPARVVNPSAIAKTTTKGHGYVGTSTLGDTTAAGK